MIPFNFDYFKPESIDEAIKVYSREWKLGKKIVYFNGGTEVITFARGGKLEADSIIDLKGIPECNVLEMNNTELIIGASKTLNQLIESNPFPLLSETARHVADHTSRNKITIGGNLFSQLNYRECLMPLLIADAVIVIVQPEGMIEQPIEKFTALQLSEGEFVTQIKVPISNLHLPYASLKRTRTSKVGYPIVSLAAFMKDERIRIAFGGINKYPFRSTVVEAVLNDRSLERRQRIDKAIAKLPAAITDDLIATRSFRKFILGTLLSEAEIMLEEKS